MEILRKMNVEQFCESMPSLMEKQMMNDDCESIIIENILNSENNYLKKFLNF